ncbi:helix-turn-helix transcriptional regulator [Hoeflea sp.]|uniref:helix-turn-helix transcriptional regulator n=1 Tax=Hyphomicrobiales TaxID=356 RepID=UPI003A90DF20
MTLSEYTLEDLCDLFGYTPKGRPISRKEFSEFSGLSVDTLEGHALRGTGPRYFKPEGTRRVWYAERDVLAWLASGARQSTSDQPEDYVAA